MMRSLYSGVAGLRTHQTKMDVLGNNIANVNTTSFKSQSITFSDLMYQTTQSASGATETKGGVNARQIGLGAKSGAIATAIESQGATQTTNNPFDIMITGKSFFVVNNGKQNLYTRDGSFYVDGAGNLAMQSNGYYVMGWAAQEDAETGEITVNKNGGLTNLQVMSAANMTYSPASTTAALFSGNIDDNDSNVMSDDGKTITLEFYDNKGYLYTGKFTLKDTGTEDLFSLQLTDIIDSSGNSIGSTLMKGVSFGSTESSVATVTDEYEVLVGQTTATVNLLAGASVYTGVPTSGTLSDLMTTSKSSYAGMLNKIYGVTDAMVTSGTYGYSATSAYEISEDGTLTITYNVTDAKTSINNSATGNKFAYTASNSNSYYVTTSTGDDKGLSYMVPSSDGGTVSGLDIYRQATLKNVFGVSTTEMNTYLNDKTYKYTFTSNASGNDVVKVYRSSGLTEYTQANATKISNFSSYYDGYFISHTSDTLSGYSALYPSLQTMDSSYSMNKYYSYVGDNNYVHLLTVYGSKYSGGVEVSTTANSTVTSLSELSKNTLYTYSDLTDDQKQELASVMFAAGKLTENTTDALDTYMANGDGTNAYTNFMVENLTGTTGVIFYTSTPTAQEVDTSVILYQGYDYQVSYNADEDTYPTSTPASVYRDSNSGVCYALTGSESTVADYGTDMLKQIYNLAKSDYDSDSLVSITSSGLITIYHEATTTPSMSTDYAASLEDDGTLTYITTIDTEAYSDVPLTGNITDLLRTASGDYKNLLYKVYGLSDEDADAYGTDGTYTLNADGSITLTTGTQTIQLKFNAANGSLTTANGNSNGLVNLVFDQSIDGLEAFGYQSSTDDDAADAGKLTVDFSTITNYNTSGSSTIKAVKGDISSLNTGRMVGEMNGINVSTDGQIFATYSNGQTKLLGQIASAEFANASGLAKEGDNLYSSTLNSGDPTVQDITTDGGYMNTGVLEMSNVDLSKEFTEMITTQRGFQANSRIITVSDTLLEELTNLKR